MWNINKYKKAKIFEKELSKAISILDTSIKDLIPYKKYDSVNNCLIAMDATKDLLTFHLKIQKKVIANKGGF